MQTDSTASWSSDGSAKLDEAARIDRDADHCRRGVGLLRAVASGPSLTVNSPAGSPISTRSPLDNMTVTLRNAVTGAEVRTTTARGGRYHFIGLAQGEYSLTATGPSGSGKVDGIFVAAGHAQHVQTAIDLVRPGLAQPTPDSTASVPSSNSFEAFASCNRGNPCLQPSPASASSIPESSALKPTFPAAVVIEAQDIPNRCLFNQHTCSLGPGGQTRRKRMPAYSRLDLVPPVRSQRFKARPFSNHRNHWIQCNCRRSRCPAAIGRALFSILPATDETGERRETFRCRSDGARDHDRRHADAAGVREHKCQPKPKWCSRPTRSRFSRIRTPQCAGPAIPAGSASENAGPGRTNVDTQRGTDHLHGQAFVFDRQNLWDARNPFTQWVQETAPASHTTIPVFTPRAVQSRRSRSAVGRRPRRCHS